MGYPAAIELAIWLNQFRSGLISRSDVLNALETVTQNTSVDWVQVIDHVAKSEQPCFALLPIPGLTYGLPAQVLKQINSESGVCIINGKTVLSQSLSKDATWQLFEVPHLIAPPEPKEARISFQQLLDESVTELAAMQAQGDRTSAEHKLEKLKLTHLPPALPSRVKNDLDLAQRIWLITEVGAQESQVFHSPSLDDRKIHQLRKLKIAAINLMSAVTLTA